MTKQLLISAAILVAFVVVAVLLIANRSKPPQRPIENHAPLVQTAPVEVQTGALKVAGSGTVRPRAEVALAAQVSGQVVFVNPALVSGGYVRKGETLIRIDGSDYDNAVDQAKADVAQQEVSVLQAEEEAALARAEYDRFRERENRRAADVYASIDSNDYAARLLPPADAAVDTGSQKDLLEPGGLVFREPQLRAARAALQRSRALLANAELSSNRTVVRAPFSGFVRSKNVAVGSFLSPGQSFAQLVASDIFEINVPMTREEAALIPNLWTNGTDRRNAAAVYAEYGGLRYRWPGFVDRAEAVLDPETRTINVVIRVPSPITSGRMIRDDIETDSERGVIVPTQSPPLLVGEFVEVEIDGAAFERYIAIPRSALKPDENIWVVRDGALQILPVQVLQQVEAKAFVLADGVFEGDQIVTSDLSVATHGMRVRLASDASGSADPSKDSPAVSMSDDG